MIADRALVAVLAGLEGIDRADRAAVRGFIVAYADDRAIAAVFAAPEGGHQGGRAAAFAGPFTAALRSHFGPDGPAPRPAVLDAFDQQAEPVTAAAFHFASAAHRLAAHRAAAAAMTERLVAAGLAPSDAGVFVTDLANEFIDAPTMHRFTGITRAPFAYLRDGVADAIDAFARAWAADRGQDGGGLNTVLEGEAGEAIYRAAVDWVERFWRPDTGSQHLPHLLRYTPARLGRAALGIIDDPAGLPVTLTAPATRSAPPAWHTVTPAPAPDLADLPPTAAIAAVAATVPGLDEFDQDWILERLRAVTAADRTAALLHGASDRDAVAPEVARLLRHQIHRGLVAATSDAAAHFAAAEAAGEPMIAAMTAYVLDHHRPDLAAPPPPSTAAEIEVPLPALDAAGTPTDVRIAAAYLAVATDRTGLDDAEAQRLYSRLDGVGTHAELEQVFDQTPAADRYRRWADLVDADMATFAPGAPAAHPRIWQAWEAHRQNLTHASYWAAAAAFRDFFAGELRESAHADLAAAHGPMPRAAIQAVLDHIDAFIADPAITDWADPFGQDWPHLYADLAASLAEASGDDPDQAELATTFDVAAAANAGEHQDRIFLRQAVRSWAVHHWSGDPAPVTFAEALAALDEADRARVLAGESARLPATGPFPVATASANSGPTTNAPAAAVEPASGPEAATEDAGLDEAKASELPGTDTTGSVAEPDSAAVPADDTVESDEPVTADRSGTAAARDAIYDFLESQTDLEGYHRSELWRLTIDFAEVTGAALIRTGQATSADHDRFAQAFTQACTAWFEAMPVVPRALEAALTEHRQSLLQVVCALAETSTGFDNFVDAEPAPPPVPSAPEGTSLTELSEAMPERIAIAHLGGPTTEAEPVSEPATPAPAAEPEAETTPRDAAGRYRPTGQDDLAHSGGPAARARANIAALRTLRRLEAEDRPATAEEQTVLARWSGWGAASQVFDEDREQFAEFRAELHELLNEAEYRAARASVLNAHYTDAAYVQAIWDAVAALGFDGGAVLEPGCGSGNFIAFAPESAAVTGVELDPTTAAIAGALYPDATILPASFAKIDAVRDSFDLTVGNVPFHNSKVHDPAFNPAEHTLHNYFILKSLQLTRPGGLVAVLTSSFTMDAVNPAVRRELAGLADLVGAVRLPNRAHRAAAGTDALTDVLLFRRREPEAAPASGADAWELTVPISPDGTGPRMNAYFTAHPEYVLGEVGLERNMHASETVTVTGPADPAAIATALRAALDQIVAEARSAGLTVTDRGQAAPAPAAALTVHTQAPPEHFIRETQPHSGNFEMWAAGSWHPHKVPKTQVKELRSLLGLRDAALALIDAEAASVDDTDQIGQLRAELNDRYDGYVARFGPINRVTRAYRTVEDPDTGKRVPLIDEDTGEQKFQQRSPGQGGFRSDAHAYFVRALERYDPVSGKAEKMPIFSERTLFRRAPVLGADTPADALAISLDRTGGIDLDLVASLLGIAPADAREALGTLVFDDPDTGELVTAAEYCSGDIRYKLDLARSAAEVDESFAPNVEALTAVCPPYLSPAEITPRMGAVWIPAADHQAFLRELLDDASLVVEHGGGSTWAIDQARLWGPAATSTWGTEKMPAPKIAHHLMRAKPIRIMRTVDTVDGEREVLDQTATTEATAKAEAMAEAFRSWIWSDPERTDRLVEVYNRTFNTAVPRTYTGEHLTLPGLSAFYTLRPHQRAAIDRMIHEPSTGLFHEVGAGKTLEMVVGTMELKRLGLATKPAIVVPNHMLDQFTREFLDAYPQAQLLAASSKDLTDKKRREFLGRIAASNCDAVILTHKAFEKIGISREEQIRYFEAEQAMLEDKAASARQAGQRLTVKELEGSIQRIETRIAKLQDAAQNKTIDTDLTFEQTGIDFLSIDEAHLFKNLRRASDIEGMTILGSNRASDLHMKLEYLRSQGRRHVAAFATATPLPNSMGEVHTMLKYLRPDLLEAQGVLEFDAWANVFGEMTSGVEIAPEGGTRAKTRFAKFTNVPELMRTFHITADIKLAADLNLPVPDLAPRPSDGKREAEIVALPISTPLSFYMDILMSRAGEIRGGGVDPKDDNMLKIAGDGRAAAADVRLRGMEPDDEPQKADIAADKIAQIWAADRDTVYTDPATGKPHPVPGGLQLVFCDQGTPKDGQWSVYEQLRRNLVDRGMDRSRIRFIHEANGDKEKAELFAAARTGGIDVLIGSTEKMGVGTNVQTRITALHHLDCPWRPADVVQREGRAIRQGNQNAEVRILRYVVEGSFDAFMWQTVARKAQFIAQVMRADAGVREIEDIDETTLSFNEVKAIASGDPRILEHAEAAAAVAKLEAAERAHHSSLRQLHRIIATNNREIPALEQLKAAFDAAIPRRVDTRGEAFTVTIAGAAYTEFNAANQALRAELSRLFTAKLPIGTSRIIGAFAGFDLEASVDRHDAISLRLDDAPKTRHQVTFQALATAQPLTKLRNALNKLEANRDKTQAEIDQLRADITNAEASLDAPFPKAAELEAARLRFTELDDELAGPGEEANAEADLPPGGVRIDYDTGAKRATATGITPGHLGPDYRRIADGLDQAGFTLTDTETGEWTRPLAATQPLGQDPAPEELGRTYEQLLGGPVQLSLSGEVQYTSQAAAEPAPEAPAAAGDETAEPAPEAVAEQDDSLPPDHITIDVDNGYRASGVDPERLGDRYETVVAGLRAEGFAPLDGADGRWEKPRPFDSRGDFASPYYGPHYEQLLGVPIELRDRGRVRYQTPPPSTDDPLGPIPDRFVRVAYSIVDGAATTTITGVSADRIGTDRVQQIHQWRRPERFTAIPGGAGFTENTTLAPNRVDLYEESRSGVSLEHQLAGPVQVYKDDQLVYQSPREIRLDLDGDAAIRVAGVTADWLGASYLAVVDRLRAEGFTPVDGTEDQWENPQPTWDTSMPDATWVGLRYEQRLGVPVQAYDHGRWLYRTPRQPDAAEPLPEGTVGLNFTPGALEAVGVDPERLGDRYDTVVAGLRTDRFHRSSTRPDRWSQLGSGLDDGRGPERAMTTAELERHEAIYHQLLGVPLQLRQGATVYQSPSSAPAGHSAPIPDQYLRLSVQPNGNQGTITIAGIAAGRIGADRVDQVHRFCLVKDFEPTPGTDAWVYTGRVDVADDQLAASGPSWETRFSGPVQLYNEDRLVYQTEQEPDTATGPDGTAAAKSAAAAIGGGRAAAPVSPAAPAPTETPEPDRAR